MIKKIWTIRDPIYGDIEIRDVLIRDLINCKEFQRLRFINQLGGSQFVFTGATHTRFSHCVGVYHVLTLMLELIPKLKQKISLKNQRLLLIAGLLHDIGHGPFSHTFEKLTNVDHEQYTADIILNPETEINKILLKYDQNPQAIVNILQHKSEPLISNLISSQIDADRMDYLLRDSYYVGVSYGNFELTYLLKNTHINRNNLLCFSPKTVYALENYIIGRYHMHQQVYHHPKSEGFEVTLLSLFKRLKNLINNDYEFKTDITMIKPLLINKKLNTMEYLNLNDNVFLTIIQQLTSEQDELLKNLAERILTRKFLSFYRVNDEDFEVLKKKVCDAMIKQGYDTSYYFSTGTEKKIILYSLDPEEQILIFNKHYHPNTKPLTDYSQFINKQSASFDDCRTYMCMPYEIYTSIIKKNF